MGELPKMKSDRYHHETIRGIKYLVLDANIMLPEGGYMQYGSRWDCRKFKRKSLSYVNHETGLNFRTRDAAAAATGYMPSRVNRNVKKNGKLKR